MDLTFSRLKFVMQDKELAIDRWRNFWERRSQNRPDLSDSESGGKKPVRDWKLIGFKHARPPARPFRLSAPLPILLLNVNSHISRSSLGTGSSRDARIDLGFGQSGQLYLYEAIKTWPQAEKKNMPLPLPPARPPAWPAAEPSRGE